MFIHFGRYAIPGRGEWVQWNEQIPVEEYAKLAQQFNPTNFNPDTWAETAKAAPGMKYMGANDAPPRRLLACSDDKGNDFTSVWTAAHRDLVAEYAAAVRKAGLRVGFYYSPLDWRFPGLLFSPMSSGRARRRCETSITGRWRNCSPTTANSMWSGSTAASRTGSASAAIGRARPGKNAPASQHYKGGFSWQHDQVLRDMLRRLQPQAIINGRADMPEDFHSREGDGALGDFDDEHPWELCTTLAGAWGWEPNKPVKPLRRLRAVARQSRRARRQSPPQRRHETRRPDRSAASPAPARNRRLARPVRRQHLRHARRPVSARQLRHLHPS